MRPLNERLKQMVGRTYLYKTATLKIENFTISESKVTLVTDKGFIDKNPEEMTDFLLDLLPATESTVTVIQQTVDNSAIKSLKEILMDNIERVKKDANYIPQSDEINKNVKSYIDIVKAEIEIIKISKQ